MKFFPAFIFMFEKVLILYNVLISLNFFNLGKQFDLLPSDDSVVFAYNFITLALKYTGMKGPTFDDKFIHPEESHDDKAVQVRIIFYNFS